MHDPACNDSDFRRWWPVGEVQEQPLSALPASGTTTNPVRLVDVMRVSRDEEGNVVEVEDESGAAWIGFWGPFTGLRVSYSPRNSYRISSGAAIVAPKKDLFLSVDAVNAGTASIARFHSREAALAWGQSNNEILRAGGALGPFPTATVIPAQNDPLPTTTRIGSVTQLYNATAAKLDLWRGESWNADGSGFPTYGIGNVQAFNQIWSDRGASNFRLRQPNATAPKSGLSSAISLASTGVKAQRTMAQDGYIRFAVVSTLTGTPTNAVVQLQVVRAATTYAVGNTGQLPATLNVSFPIGFTTTNVAPWIGIPVVAGDVVQINVLTASAAATADFALCEEENLYLV